MPNLKTCLLSPRFPGFLRRTQRGAMLLESLVSILVLALGVMALSGVQLRTLAETQTSVRRAQAVRAIEDLAERIKANPDGYGQLRSGSYTSGWDADMASTDDGCSTHTCNPGELAHSDLVRWRNNLAQTLPMGRANVFMSADETADPANGRQLAVMVGWRSTERPHADDAALPLPFHVSAAGIECPEALICHLAYVQP